MTRQARTFLLVVALILVAGISSSLTWLAGQIPNDTRPLPALAEGLSSTSATARQQFADRVRARFPVGSSERALMLELWSEAFGHPGAGEGHRYWASLERRDVVCTKVWTVTWTADDGDHLTAIDGTYIPSCS